MAADDSMVSGDQAWPRESYGWYVVFVLCVCGIVAFIDRQIINLLVEDIKADLNVSDVQISLLQGLAFASFYATVAVPLGRLADAVNRRLLIAVAIVLWTLAALSCGMADSYGELFVARMFIGVGEAVLTPAGFSLLADYFRPRRLSLPVSVFTGSSFFGSGVALLAGGALIAYLAGVDSLVFPVLGELRPWQAAFIFGALPGFPVALWFFLSVREPERRSNPQLSSGVELRTGFVQALRYIRRHGRMFCGIFLGLSLVAAANFSMGAWVPAFFIRVHGWEASQVGWVYGWLFLICGSGGVIVGGWFANLLHARGFCDSNLRAPLIGVVLALPFAIAFTQVESAKLAVALMVPLMFFSTLPFGAGTAVLPIVTPPQFRAQLVAIYLLIANVVGQAGGPWVVALLTDNVFGDPMQVGQSISVTVGILLLTSAFFLTLGLQPVRQLLSQETRGD